MGEVAEGGGQNESCSTAARAGDTGDCSYFTHDVPLPVGDHFDYKESSRIHRQRRSDEKKKKIGTKA
jgi:hypothetical protein